MNAARGLDTIDGWHFQVHQNDIGLEMSGQFNRLCPIGYFPHDLYPWGRGKHGMQTLACDCLVIGNQDADGLQVAHLLASLKGIQGKQTKTRVPP